MYAFFLYFSIDPRGDVAQNCRDATSTLQELTVRGGHDATHYYIVRTP